MTPSHGIVLTQPWTWVQYLFLVNHLKFSTQISTDLEQCMIFNKKNIKLVGLKFSNLVFQIRRGDQNNSKKDIEIDEKLMGMMTNINLSLISRVS
jgi:hypothetical protein